MSLGRGWFLTHHGHAASTLLDAPGGTVSPLTSPGMNTARASSAVDDCVTGVVRQLVIDEQLVV